jgi:hypothetical protein
MSAYHCKCGRTMGRYDSECSACFAAKIFGMPPEPPPAPVSHRTMVLCACFGDSDPDPDCPECEGFGEVEAPDDGPEAA